MKLLKAIARKFFSWLKRAWRKTTEVDLETYVRELEAMEERARIRAMYERGWWL